MDRPPRPRRSRGIPARFLATALVAFAAGPLRAQLVPSWSQTVFAGGAEGPDGTPFYRIPTLAVAPDGALLAFAEGRNTPSDPGSGHPISMNCKRSTDHGHSWSAVRVLASDPAYAYSDPRVVVDRRAGRVFIFYTQWPVSLGARKVPPGTGSGSSVLFYRSSADSGLTWGPPVNLNPALKNPAWHYLAAIVGVGVQLSRQTLAEGAANGRLIFPACFADAGRIRHDVSVYSDDSGRTWRISPTATTNDGASESDLIERADGRLLLSARDDGSGSASRYHYLSGDGGRSWTLLGPEGIPVTRVDCGLVHLGRRASAQADWVLLSAPLGTPVGSGSGRSNLGVWKSVDGGLTFPTCKQVASGYSSYSQIIQLSDSTVGILFEPTHATRIDFLQCAIDDL